MFKYDNIIRNTLLNYKFREKPYLSKTFSKILNKYKKIYLQLDFYDIIIPIPISKQRKKERGYDQCLLIAKEIAKDSHIKLENKIIKKTTNNIPQSKLNKNEREKNVKNVYKLLNMEKIINKNILLIDDIFTTGATANQCSRILKLAGVKQVDILTIAKD